MGTEHENRDVTAGEGLTGGEGSLKHHAEADILAFRGPSTQANHGQE